MQQFRPPGFSVLPEVVKNLLIINTLFFLATITFDNVFHIDLTNRLGLHYWGSEKFRSYQFVTYMFMHGGFSHLFFNMLGIWMFGSELENVWGPKRFLIYYLLTGLGAAIIHYAIIFWQIQPILGATNISEDFRRQLLDQPNIVGASGALFGILLAYGMIFPNTIIYFQLIFPIKAKYFVMIYGAMELYSGIQNNPGDNVGHFAHLGGMLFGFIILRYWRKKGFY